MHKIQHIVFYIILAILAAGCGNHENGLVSQPSDTIYTSEKASELYYQDPQRAFIILDSAEILGNISHQEADILRARFYGYNESSKDTARAICMQLLAEGGLKGKQQADLLEVLVYVARMYSDDEGVLKYGIQYIDVCHQLGDETQALLTQTEMGEALIHLGRSDEGFAKMDDAIAKLDKVRRFCEMDACVRAMKSKIRILFDRKRYDELIPVAERIVEKLTDFDDHPADYDDGSDRMPTDERRPGYVDWYTGQAYAFMAAAYAMMADDQIDGQTDNQTIRKSINPLIQKSKECLALFDQTDYSKTINGKKLISSTWCHLGEYNKMLAFYDELQPLWGSDTLHHDYAVMLRNRAIAARHQGRLAQAYDYMQRYQKLTESLNDAERLATAQEYAARYHEQEQQLALEKEQAAKKRMGSLAVFLGIIVLLAVIFIVILLRQAFSIRKKNAVLSKEISERIGYEEKYLTSTRVIENHNIRTSEHPNIRTSDIASLSDRELYEHIRHLVSEEHLHLDPQFGRDQLMERLQLSKDRVGAAFSQGSDYGNISNFLNDLRLSHSAKLLTEHPEMSIEEVATASGFSNRVVFSRNFKEHFAMSPSEFREKK